MAELEGALKPRAVAKVSFAVQKRGWGLLVGGEPGSQTLILPPALGGHRALGISGNSEEGHPGPPLTGERRVQEPGDEALELELKGKEGSQL